MAIEVSDQNFKSEVIDSGVPVLVDFWGEGWGPCKRLAPVMDELAVEFDGRAKVVKINTGENFEAASNLGVRMLPTLFIFKGGKPIQQLVGFKDKASLAALLEKAIAG